MTPHEAIGNAVRLLNHAEVETDRALMERFGAIADSWTAIAQILLEMETAE